MIARLGASGFLAAAAGMVTAGFLLYGSPSRTDALRLAQDAAGRTLEAGALAEFSPAEPPGWQRTVTMLAWLSLSEITMQTARSGGARAALVDITGRTGHWPNVLSLTPLPATAASHRLVVGWALDSGTASLIEDLKNSPGLSVLAPKWLHVDSPTGSLTGSIEPAVVSAAHKRGIAVWAVVDCAWNAAATHAFLQYQDRQNALIGRIVATALAYHLNGINLDFEGLGNQDRWNYARFVSVLAGRLHRYGLTLSVDLPPDYADGHNQGPYNHAAIAAAANYVVMMGYDQHWTGDAYPGPTASLPWVNSGVQDMLTTGVPAAKLILGIPFYSQNWTIGNNGTAAASQPLSLVQEERLLSNVGGPYVWNRNLGEYVDDFQVGGAQHEIWVEDERSLLLTLELVNQDHLAGAAAWYLGLETPATWSSVVASVRSGNSV